MAENRDTKLSKVSLLGTDDVVPKYTFGTVSRSSASSYSAKKKKRPRRYEKKQKKATAINDSNIEGAATSFQVPQADLYIDDNDSETEFEYLDSNVVECPGELEKIVTQDVKDVYLFQIMQAKAFFTINNKFTLFLIQDFNLEQTELKLHSYCFVNRHLVTVSDSKVIVLTCSCDESKKDFLKSISFHYVGEPDAFTQLITSQFPDCLHLKVASELIPTIDKVNNIDPFEINSYIVEDDHEYAKVFTEFKEIRFSSENLILVKPINGNFAVIGTDRRGFVCHTCTYGCHSCNHILSLKEAIDSDNDSLPDFVVDMIATHNALQESSIRSVFVRPVSYELFKWETTLQQRRIYRLYKELSSSFLPDGTLALVPPGDPCNVCGGPMTSVVGEDGLKPLFLLADSVNVTVFVRACEECRFVRYYCGSADGMLHMKGFLVGHDVLRDYLHLFLTGNSCSLVGYYEKWKLNLHAAGINSSKFLNYQQWRFSWYAFLNLLEIDYKHGFTCDVCGQYPDVLSCDATSLGFKRIFQQKTNMGGQAETLLKGSSFRSRVMIRSQELRSLVTKFSAKEVLDSAAKRKLMELLQAESLHLYNFFMWCDRVFQAVEDFPPALLTLLKCISSVSAALSYYPIDDQFLSVMEEVRAGAVLQCCPEKLLLVRRKAPIMHDFLISLPKESVANEVNGLLLEMESRIGWIIGKDPHRLPYVTEEAQSDFSFLPNWPVLNERGAYAKDVSSSKKVSKDCRKDYRGHPSLMPGIFTLHCMHDICYGFDVMETQESPNTPFTILRTRFSDGLNLRL